MNYRERIYKDCASVMQDAGEKFDSAAADHWGRAYRHYLRNWLPTGKTAAIADLACGGGKLLHFFS